MSEENAIPAVTEKNSVKVTIVKLGPKAARKKQPRKRDRLHAKRELINKAHKSRVSTASRKLADLIAKKESPEVLEKQLSLVSSLMDKGVKRGIFKINKAARTKSRLAAKI